MIDGKSPDDCPGKRHVIRLAMFCDHSSYFLSRYRALVMIGPSNTMHEFISSCQ